MMMLMPERVLGLVLANSMGWKYSAIFHLHKLCLDYVEVAMKELLLMVEHDIVAKGHVIFSSP